MNKIDDKGFGILTKIIGGFYYVEVDNKLYECKARGVFRKNNITPIVGDRVEITINQGAYSLIDRVLERKNLIVRPALANIDNLVIVSSAVDPNVNLYLIDKMIAAATVKDITPIVVFSKSDLSSVDQYLDIYKKAGIKAIEFSSVDLRGIDDIRSLLKDKVTAFCGNSGVGKSTLLNSLFPELSLLTGETSQKLGRGKHTTRTVELFSKYGGYVADTPGFSSMDLERYEIIKKNDLQYAFVEFSDYINKCRFNSCMHICEKGCAVLEAVNNGIIPKSRHDSYIRMYEEVKDLKDWQIK